MYRKRELFLSYWLTLPIRPLYCPWGRLASPLPSWFFGQLFLYDLLISNFHSNFLFFSYLPLFYVFCTFSIVDFCAIYPTPIIFMFKRSCFNGYIRILSFPYLVPFQRLFIMTHLQWGKLYTTCHIRAHLLVTPREITLSENIANISNCLIQSCRFPLYMIESFYFTFWENLKKHLDNPQ